MAKVYNPSLLPRLMSKLVPKFLDVGKTNPAEPATKLL